MDPDVVVSTRPFRNIGLSKAAQTHKLRKLRTPAKCRECDSYVYFQGAECEEVSPSSGLYSFILQKFCTIIFSEELFFKTLFFKSTRKSICVDFSNRFEEK